MQVRGQGRKTGPRVLLAIGACAAAVACGGSPTSPSPGGNATTPPASLTSFEITAATPAVTTALPSRFPPHLWIVAGESAQLFARAGFSDGSVRDVTGQVAWDSTNAVVASVSSTGVLTARRAGQTPLAARYQTGAPANTLVSVFGAALSIVESFSGILPLGERRSYVVTVGAGGGDVVFILTSTGPGSALLGVMFGHASESVCRPPYVYGTSWLSSRDAGTGNRSDARSSVFQRSPGQSCVIVLDPATVTPADQLPPPSVLLRPMNLPVNYTLTIGVSGTGSAVSAG